MNVERKQKWKLLFDYLKKYKKWGFLGGLFMILNILMLMPTPLLTMYLIDTVIPTGDIHMLGMICSLCILILILSGLFGILQNLYFSKFNYRVIFDIQFDILDKVRQTSAQFRNKKQTGYLMSRINDDPGRLQNLFADTLVSLIKDILILITGSIIIFVINWQLALVSVVLLPFFIITLQKFGVKIRSLSTILFEYGAQFTKKLQESVSLMDTFFIFNAEKDDTIKLVAQEKKVIRTGIKRTIIQSVANAVVSLIGGLGPICVLWFGIAQIIKGNLTLGELIAFNSFLGYIFGPTGRLINTALSMQQSIAALDRVAEMLLNTPSVKRTDIKAVNKTVEGRIEFKNIRFKYDNELILSDINLLIPAGQTVAIVGKSGSGKSTLVSLITQLNRSAEGSVEIDGLPVSSIKTLRQQTALVNQEPALIAATIGENIKIGNSRLSDAEIIEAAKKANIHDFIMSLPKQYDEPVDERGLNMSIGQKQRIAIARCIVRNPAIFIMDEPTANLDLTTEKMLMTSLREFMAERTTIIITHRLSSITFVDRIIVIDHGIVVEEGAHDDLLNRNSFYAQLWQNHISEIEN
jgi:ABC-type bacteriocin/lantibiotic exporter with double-glycine peptidase domain